MDGMKGQSELEAINALAGRSVHWMGCIVSVGARWVHHSLFLFAAGHCT